jgi:single-stranded-DNA-specific exonuclease
MRAVAFGQGEWAEEIATVKGPLSVSFAPVINSFRGFEKVELRLLDWKAAT